MSPRCRTRVILIAVSAILLTPGFSQTNSSNSGNPLNHHTDALSNSDPGGGPLTPESTPHSAQPAITVSGRVMIDDGTPPTNSAVIERVCNGVSHSQGYTDSEGYFSVQLGQTTAVLEDASEGEGNLAKLLAADSAGLVFALANRFADCDLRARLGGYRSQTVSLIDHGPLDSPEIGVILLHRLDSSEPATVTASDLKAPKAAHKALQKALDLAKKNKPGEAMKSLREALRIDPDYAAAWRDLGKIQSVQGQADQARQSFEAAAKAEPRWPDPLLELSLLALRAHNWPALSDVTDRLLLLDSFAYPQAYLFNAVANYYLKRLDIAERNVREAEKLDTRHQYPQTAHLLAAILTDHHRYAEAANELRNYLAAAPKAADAPTVRRQLNDIEKMSLMQASEAGR